jgi:hypothetical protein
MELQQIQAVSVDFYIYVLGGCDEDSASLLKFCTTKDTWSMMASSSAAVKEPAISSVGSDIYNTSWFEAFGWDPSLGPV